MVDNGFAFFAIIREYQDEREGLERDRRMAETRLTELITSLTSALGAEARETDLVVNRVSMRIAVCV